jgi:hypothetical protein
VMIKNENTKKLAREGKLQSGSVSRIVDLAKQERAAVLLDHVHSLRQGVALVHGSFLFGASNVFDISGSSFLNIVLDDIEKDSVALREDGRALTKDWNDALKKIVCTL